jgi:hypothetical protein
MDVAHAGIITEEPISGAVISRSQFRLIFYRSRMEFESSRNSRGLSSSSLRSRKCCTDVADQCLVDGRLVGTHAQTTNMMNCCPMCLKIQCRQGLIVAANPLGQSWVLVVERRATIGRGAAGAVDRL